MTIKRLTLKECVSQADGIIGRLFEPPSTAMVSEISTYRVTELRGEVMDIETYVLGGSTKSLHSVPIKERYRDTVMESSDLMEWYVGVGRAMGSPRGCSALLSV